MAAKIRVVCVDDSALIRQMLTDIFTASGKIEVVGIARDGAAGLEKIKLLKPDVVTMDIEMPVMNGIDTLKHIMKECPVPVVMISSLTKQGSAETVRALSLGAIDFIPKPESRAAVEMPKLSKMICDKILNASQVKLKRSARFAPEGTPKPVLERPPTIKFSNTTTVIAIGISTGGPVALRDVFPLFPANSPPVLLVQHMPEQFTGPFAERLNSFSQIQVIEAQGGEVLKPGHGYVAPGHSHITLKRVGAEIRIKLSQAPPQSGHRPSADVLFASVADVYGKKSVAALMTGMGRDGAEGMGMIKAKGGLTIAQDESTSIVWGMPKVAYERGYAAHLTPLNKITNQIMTCVSKL